MDEVLNSVLDLDPATTRTAVIEAAEVIQAELVESPCAPALTAPAQAALPPAKPERDLDSDALDEDVDFAREQMKQIIDDGRSALNGIMELAAAGDEPRAYEVVAELMQATVQANRELINLHEVRKKAKKADAEAKAKLAEVSGAASASGPSVSIDKAVFVGRASDLLRELQAVKKQTIAALAGKA